MRQLYTGVVKLMSFPIESKRSPLKALEDRTLEKEFGSDRHMFVGIISLNEFNKERERDKYI